MVGMLTSLNEYLSMDGGEGHFTPGCTHKKTVQHLVQSHFVQPGSVLNRSPGA